MDAVGVERGEGVSMPRQGADERQTRTDSVSGSKSTDGMVCDEGRDEGRASCGEEKSIVRAFPRSCGLVACAVDGGGDVNVSMLDRLEEELWYEKAESVSKAIEDSRCISMRQG